MKTIEIISIPVTDQQRGKEFYQKLGFELRNEVPFGKDQLWLQLGFSGQDASITLVNWFPQMPPGCITGFVIQTENIEAEIKDLNSKGIKVGAIDNTPWGKFASVKDPDGNTMSLHEGV